MSVEKRPNGKYRARLYVDGKEKAKHFTRKLDAERWEREQKTSRDRGQWVDGANRVTIAEFARAWASTRPYRPTTERNVEALIRSHIEGTRLGGMRLTAVRPSHVQAWATERSQLIGPARLKLLVQFLRTVLTDAVLDHVITANPVTKRITLPSVEDNEIVPLTVGQIIAIREHIPDRARAMVTTQAGLGLRYGELAALRVSDVDFVKRLVRIETQFVPRSTERSAPKTRKSKRTIPLPQVVADALAAHIAAYPPSQDGTLFTTTYGNYWRHTMYGRMWRNAVSRAVGVPVGTRTHDLRHHYASTLIAARLSVVEVARRLGHDDPGVTLKVYSHLFADTEDLTRQAVDAAWSQQSGLSTDSEAEAGS